MNITELISGFLSSPICVVSLIVIIVFLMVVEPIMTMIRIDKNKNEQSSKEESKEESD